MSSIDDTSRSSFLSGPGEYDMTEHAIRFDDGEAYERYMGRWSRLAGEKFLDWLAPEKGLRWLDVGCGNGAFTETIVQKCNPSSVQGIDPSDAQLAFARTRTALKDAQFSEGNAQSIPVPSQSVDVAVMPLVIFFVPDPPRGVAEMARVVRPGGFVAAYAWDLCGGGFPYEALQDEIRALGGNVPTPPQPEASKMEVLESLWSKAELKEIKTLEIVVERTFESFDEYWSTVLTGASVVAALRALSPENLESLKRTMRGRLRQDDAGKITYSARANAIRGVVSA
jgi:ubiquinone/menaquinone biosynthesis C-methylase UbiE